MKLLAATLCVGAVLALAATASAQDAAIPGRLTISGTIFGANGSPLPFSTASLAGTGVERFSNDRGEFILGNIAPGVYHLRVRQLGFAALDTVITLRAGVPLTGVRIVLSPVAFKLATVTVRDKKSCIVPTEISDRGSDFETILTELRKNAERERLLATNYPFEYRIAKSFDSDDARIAPVQPGTDTVQYRSDERPRYFPGGLVRRDETRFPPNNRMMVIPVLGDIGDPEFLRTHCFTYNGRTKDARGVVTHRIDFSPTGSIRTADVEGSAFLDGDSFVIRRAIFRLTRPESLKPPVYDLEVTTRYREIYPGVTVVGDVSSAQTVSPRFTRTIRVVESQRLVDYRFLKGQPGDTLRHE